MHLDKETVQVGTEKKVAYKLSSRNTYIVITKWMAQIMSAKEIQRGKLGLLKVS